VFDLICCRCRSCWWQYSTGIIYTGGKFAAGIIDTSGNNLPPVSITPAKQVAKFAAGVVDTGGAPSLTNISANFRKNSK
jgi:hypothetical protein